MTVTDEGASMHTSTRSYALSHRHVAHALVACIVDLLEKLARELTRRGALRMSQVDCCAQVFEGEQCAVAV